MGRLRAAPALLTRAPAPLASAPRTHASRLAANSGRAWYSTRKWQRLRIEIIERDGGICQLTGVLCCGLHPAPNSPVVDHIRPHAGNAELFWDKSNLQLLSKSAHDSIKARMEGRTRGAGGPSGA